MEERTLSVADVEGSTTLGAKARQLQKLVEIGRALDLRGGHCPLCNSEIDEANFLHGLEVGLRVAREIDAKAVEQAERESALEEARQSLTTAYQMRDETMRVLGVARKAIDEFDRELKELLLADGSQRVLENRIWNLESQREAIAADLRLIDTVSLNRAVEHATQVQESARERVARAEHSLGRARLAEGRAKVLYDAARRATAETLEQRLERVLPLMSELYKRLRPHPIWSDIDYSIRGDVRRFLKLQVGENINPQFVFSSGQRRATGLAFLLSVNLSIAWSRWRSILLDDPVQHVDDFRTVHLAEVLAHLCQSGRQIICAVEDRALADLMCRRLATAEMAPGKRVTLGSDKNGALAIVRETQVPPFDRHVLLQPPQSNAG